MKVSWQLFYELVNHLVQTVPFRHNSIYGVPRGGVPLAVELSHRFGLEMVSLDQVTPDTLVCDDIIDSGATRKKFWNNDFVSLVVRNHSTKLIDGDRTIAGMVANEWVEFPWETKQDDNGEDIVRRMLQYIGEDPNRPGLIDTPKRVVKMWKEIFRGYKEEPPEIMVVKNGDDGVKYDEMIRDEGYFYSHCEHHMVPWFGTYHFAYVADEWIMGASKIGRTINHYCAKLQIAERVVTQVADRIEEIVKPKGLMLIMDARHLCKEMRGLRMFNSPFGVTVARGVFQGSNSPYKQEFLSLLGSK
jgi:GTP cyclohydrolase I